MVDLPNLPPIPGMIGPGSQPAEEDGGTLEYMEMPKDMMIFAAPELPEPEETSGLDEALAVGWRIAGLLQDYRYDGAGNIVDLMHLDPHNLEFINQLLGEGEVSVIGGENMQAQESVMAGVWRVRTTASDGSVVSDSVEVATFPSAIKALAFAGAREEVAMPEEFGDNIFNAPALIPEINENIPKAGPGKAPYVINLSLLPHTEEDLVLLDGLMGRSGITILSRGYGNCRIIATSTRNCWWVQFYNSQDSLILNTVEITTMPEVACASIEDIEDSAERLIEIMEIYRQEPKGE
ncbi:MAG: hydrogenase expression/formation protein [Nitratireductor sp.]|nr:hydrogenase expression/formation protein [Nitratireductor sp.]MCC0020978.1 hydrogenase expression/formation protein [Nitratireductor sp.]